MFRGVADRVDIPLAEDRRLMRVMFKLEQIVGGIFEKECVVLNPGAGEPDAGLLIEGQLFRLGLFQKPLPRFFRQKSQTEMMRINALLLRQGLRRQMGHELMSCESECDGVARLPTQCTTQSIDVETFRRCHIVRRKSEMKERILHGHCPRTVGWPVPFDHSPALWDLS